MWPNKFDEATKRTPQNLSDGQSLRATFPTLHAGSQQPVLSLTSDVVPVAAVEFLYPSVPEGELAHPVDTASHARCQAQVRIGGRRVEPVRRKVVVTAGETRPINTEAP